MLQSDYTKRITASEMKVDWDDGMMEIDDQNHPYFEGIDFENLVSQQPPYLPTITPLPVILDDVG